jgi:signal transduction histidine kinase
VTRRGDRVLLTVEDDGPGIPPELRDRVFERFVRGSGDRGGSSGLGLSIVRAVAESHGGRVELGSPSGGRGTRFVVTLPAAEPDGARALGATGPAGATAGA